MVKFITQKISILKWTSCPSTLIIRKVDNTLKSAGWINHLWELTNDYNHFQSRVVVLLGHYSLNFTELFIFKKIKSSKLSFSRSKISRYVLFWEISVFYYDIGCNQPLKGTGGCIQSIIRTHSHQQVKTNDYHIALICQRVSLTIFC